MVFKKREQFENKKEIILRDYLALERTKLANDRTLFSYIRTSLYLILAGIAFLKLEDFESVQWFGLVAFGVSAILLIIGFVNFFVMRKKLKKYYIYEKPFEEEA